MGKSSIHDFLFLEPSVLYVVEYVTILNSSNQEGTVQNQKITYVDALANTMLYYV
jgi:hypothetical protein